MRLVDAAFPRDGLVGGGAFVEFLVAVAEDDDALLGGVVEVGGQLFPLLGVDVLCLLDDDEVDGRHHGVAFGVADDGSHGGVASVDHRLVEVAHRLVNDVVLEEVGDHIDIVVFLACEEVNGLEDARL